MTQHKKKVAKPAARKEHEPSLGRFVYYFQDGADEPLAALIVYVVSETVVNLVAFDHGGRPLHGSTINVAVLQHGDDAPEQGHYCTFP